MTVTVYRIDWLADSSNAIINVIYQNMDRCELYTVEQVLPYKKKF